jgi:uracil permease
MTGVVMIVGLSGAKLTFGTVTVQGMVLATLVAIVLSLVFHLFDYLHIMNE